MVERKYAVLIDAGSSGSRVYLYTWAKSPGAYPNVTPAVDYIAKKVEIGLATLAPKLNPPAESRKAIALSDQVAKFDSIPEIELATATAVKVYFDPLFDHVLRALPRSEIALTPLFVLATGGMRRIEHENPAGYELLCSAIRKYINTQPFASKTYETISGEDEALFGWVSANEIDNMFRPPDDAHENRPHGFVEMGGESAQFAMSVSSEQAANYRGLLRKLKIRDVQYTVYVKSWMGLGAESAWKRHEARLRANESVLPHDPCLPKEYAYRLAGSDKVVLGTGNFNECLEECFELFECPNKECQKGSLCIFRQGNVGCLLRDSATGSPTITFEDRDFRGASVFRHATYGIFGTKNDDFVQFWAKIEGYALMKWPKLKLQRPDQKFNGYKHVIKAFFTAGLVMSTLFLGFGVLMPEVAHTLASGFAKMRAQLALEAAEKEADEAQKKLTKAGIALKAAAQDATDAETARRTAVAVAPDLAAEALAMGALTACTETYLVRQTEANCQDVMDAITEVTGGVARQEAAEELARKTRGAVREAGDAARKRTESLVKANSELRRANQRRADAENIVRRVPVHENGPGYSASNEKADWTHGRIVLYLNRYKRDERTKEGWRGTWPEDAVN